MHDDYTWVPAEQLVEFTWVNSEISSLCHWQNLLMCDPFPNGGLPVIS